MVQYGDVTYNTVWDVLRNGARDVPDMRNRLLGVRIGTVALNAAAYRAQAAVAFSRLADHLFAQAPLRRYTRSLLARVLTADTAAELKPLRERIDKHWAWVPKTNRTEWTALRIVFDLADLKYTLATGDIDLWTAYRISAAAFAIEMFIRDVVPGVDAVAFVDAVFAEVSHG